MDGKVYCVTNMSTRPLELIRTKDESCYEYVPPDKTYFLEIVVFVFGVMPRDMELEIVLQLESEVQKVVMGYVNDDSRSIYWRSNSDIECAQLETLLSVRGHLKPRTGGADASASTQNSQETIKQETVKAPVKKPEALTVVKKPEIPTFSKKPEAAKAESAEKLSKAGAQVTIGKYFALSGDTDATKNGKGANGSSKPDTEGTHKSEPGLTNGKKLVTPTTRARRSVATTKSSKADNGDEDEDDKAASDADEESEAQSDSKGSKVTAKKTAGAGKGGSDEATPKRRGRPPKAKTDATDDKIKNVAKSTKQKDVNDDEEDDADTKKEETASQPKRRGRPPKAKTGAADEKKTKATPKAKQQQGDDDDDDNDDEEEEEEGCDDGVDTADKAEDKQKKTNSRQSSARGKKAAGSNEENGECEDEAMSPGNSQDQPVGETLTTKHRRAIKRSSRWDDFVDSDAAVTQARSSPAKKPKKAGDTPVKDEPKKTKVTSKMQADENKGDACDRENVDSAAAGEDRVPASTNKPSPGSNVGGCKSEVVEGTVEVKTASSSDSTTAPSARWGHSFSSISDDEVILIGGQGHQQAFCKDSIWLLNIETNEWKVPETVVADDNAKPEARTGHTVTFDPTAKALYLFGGSKNKKWFNDVHMLDIVEWKWQLVNVNGSAPTRSYHSTTLYRHELWIFGGVYPVEDPTPDACSNDIHVFSPLEESWYMPVVMGTKPQPRSGHSATLLKDMLVLFGGWNAPETFNDLHILDMTLVEWTQPVIGGAPPSARCWHASTALSGNRVLIHGGYDGDKALSDSAILNLDYKTWIQVHLSPAPSLRAGHVALSLPQSESGRRDDQVLIFGGGDNCHKYYNDLFLVTLKFEAA